MIELKDIINKVVLEFDEYHKVMNELELLRELIISWKGGFITLDEMREKLNEANKIYKWWL